MAIHKEFSNLVSETLSEYLCAAEYCINFKKTPDNGTWSDDGGCLGLAAATLLFSIVDAIGHHEGFGKESFNVLNEPLFDLRACFENR